MQKRLIRNGEWIEAADEKEFRAAQDGFDGSLATWAGPGRYLRLTYQERCPRGCCCESVVELIHVDQVEQEARWEIEDLRARMAADIKILEELQHDARESLIKQGV